MSQNNTFRRTDLAVEWQEDQTDLPPGIRYGEQRMDGWLVTTLHVDTPEAADLAQRGIGYYQTVELGGCLHFNSEQKSRAAALLARLIVQAEQALTKERQSPAQGRENGQKCVLVVGLGNRAMTADAVGPMTVERVTVTNHVKVLDPPLFQSLHHCAVAAICPGVLGQTGVESALTVRALSNALSPRLIIAVDALAARSSERLCTTVQLSTGGIFPGAGVGNDRPAFTEDSMGVPVLALGVPMVVDSSTLVADALTKAGINDIPPSLHGVLESGRSFFVSPKDVDGAVEVLSEILSTAIDEAMDLSS